MSDEDESPEWHRAVLEERARLIASGEAVFIDWDQAKEELLKETSNDPPPTSP
jgi:hypothetical protein